MMDASDMYPDGFHPVAQDKTRDFSRVAKYYTRTHKPPKYYFVDSGISRRYDPANRPPLEGPIIGGDKSVPEFQGKKALEDSDPFQTDVYYIGNLVRRDFLMVSLVVLLPRLKESLIAMSFKQGFDTFRKPKHGFEFMEPLVADMCDDDPAKRPKMDEVVTRFDEIIRNLSNWKLRSRVTDVSEFRIMTFFCGIPHWGRCLAYIIRRVPSIPTLTPNGECYFLSHIV
jgi:hypothetical protein